VARFPSPGIGAHPPFSFLPIAFFFPHFFPSIVASFTLQCLCFFFPLVFLPFFSFLSTAPFALLFPLSSTTTN